MSELQENKNSESSHKFALSIDIGVKNFAFALGRYTGNYNKYLTLDARSNANEESSMNQAYSMHQAYSMPPIMRDIQIVDFDVYAFKKTSPFDIMLEFSILFSKIVETHHINDKGRLKIFIEKQVPNNQKAFGIMYGILGYLRGAAYFDVQLYDPIKKFVGISYNSAKKEHKKISVQWAKIYLSNNQSLTDKFNTYSKKDDISDCVNMLLIK